MKLTNDELLKLSDPAVPQSVKDFICEQKMSEDELKVCRKMGVSPSDYLIQCTVGG